MSKVIKGGTIVTADRSYVADVLIEGETISAIGPNLSGAPPRPRPSNPAPMPPPPGAPRCWWISACRARTDR